MKKFFPALIISILFTIIMVTQMSMMGSNLGASKVKDEKIKYAAFEAVYQKLKVKTTKGTRIDFSKTKEPIVLLNFWASWCQPCLSEFSTLKKFVKEFPKEKLLVVGINNDDEEPKKYIKKTEKDLSLNFESIIDDENNVTGQFFISKIPASIVFYKGKVVHYTNEEFDFMNDDFILKIKKLLSKKR